jgi:hypothetical protein
MPPGFSYPIERDENLVLVPPDVWRKYSAGVVTVHHNGLTASTRVAAERGDLEGSAESLVLAMERSIVLWDLSDPEWVDLGGES